VITMNRFSTPTILFCLCPVLFLSGCMVGPDYERPETAAQVSEDWVNIDQRHVTDVNDLEEMDKWWLSFGDEPTAELVKEALSNNYSLEAAAARVLQAEASLAQATGRRLPDVSYGLDASREQSYIDLGEPIGAITPKTTRWQHNINVSYMLDIFGRLKRSEKAAWAQYMGAQASQQAMTNAIIANVVRARVEIATLRSRLEIVEGSIQTWLQTIEKVQRRYDAGLIGPVDVHLARENLEAARSRKPQIERQLRLAEHALDVLLGRRPGASDMPDKILAELPDVEPVPVGVPAALLDRRPDVVAAEMSLAASSEIIGVNVADLYPDLTLSGRYGRTGSQFSDLFRDETEVYSLAGQILAPIWQGGALRAEIREAEARYKELAADYAETVLNAMREVEDALVSGQTLEEEFQHLTERFSHAESAERLARQRYERGIESILAVLEAERRRREAEVAVAEIRGEIWVSRVNLFLALGGDWAAKDNTEDSQ